MTATPIPRTLALTDYSELDVSKITDLPPGRTPVRTWVKPESRRDEIYQLLRDELDRGRQAYVIYPLVEGSENRSQIGDRDGRSPPVGDLPAYRIALLHGRMKSDAKERVMQAFAAGQIHILVSTTVVEVGVDVPNASVMVVEHAERFGLSQLHQLRGRVGRGPWESHCILLYQSPWTDEARERLRALATTTVLRSPRKTSSCVDRATSSARASRVCPSCAPATWSAIATSWSRRTGRRGESSPKAVSQAICSSSCSGAGNSNSVWSKSVRPQDPGICVRVIAGTFKGRRLKAPTWAGLRPSSDKLRETLFNILAPRIEGARVLDGFAGARQAIEALSRAPHTSHSSIVTGARSRSSRRTSRSAA